MSSDFLAWNKSPIYLNIAIVIMVFLFILFVMTKTNAFRIFSSKSKNHDKTEEMPCQNREHSNRVEIKIRKGNTSLGKYWVSRHIYEKFQQRPCSNHDQPPNESLYQ